MPVVLNIVWTALAVMMIWLCWAAGRGSVPVNHFAGIRIRSTMRSPEAWRAGHRAGVPVAAVNLLLQAVLLVLACFIDNPTVGFAGLVVTLVSLGVIVFYAKRAADAA